MNYQTHYDRLMSRAEDRVLLGYVERHHVIPRCIDAESKKTVQLTPEEHYVAHQLLVKIYPGHAGLVFAANRMTHGSEKAPRNNKLYGWLRKKFAEASRDAQKGKQMSEEQKALYRHPWTESRRAAHKSHLKDRKWSSERHEAQTVWNKGMSGGTLTDEHRASLTTAQLHRYEEHPELKAQHSAAMKQHYDRVGRKPSYVKTGVSTRFVEGQEAWNTGKRWAPEVLEKMRKPRSPEGRAAIALAARLREEKKRGAACQK